MIGAGAVAGALLAALAATWLALRLLRRAGPTGEAVARRAGRPLAALCVLLALVALRQSAPLSAMAAGLVNHLAALALIVVLTWAVLGAVGVVEERMVRRYDMAAADNLLARKAQTRLAVMRRLVAALILVVAAAAMLMTFPSVRLVGGGLLASAGLVGLIAGLAAQPVIANLLAGMQIALTQPIRIDDVVVVAGYWGRIEEIDPTYVVLRVWDLRRLVLPLTYFLEQPFENWTYRGADLLGYVHVYADYGVDVGRIRDALSRILQASPAWDGKVWNLQMTGADASTVQLRALFSARDSDGRWTLMVTVREGLVDHLRREQPSSLPRYRVGTIEGGAAPSGLPLSADRSGPPARRPGGTDAG